MKIAFGISLLIILILLLKIIILKKNIRKIGQEFTERNKLNTNAKIGVSSRDADLRGLADQLNKTLESFREKYHLYSQGDMEVKRTITNVSHDLRTPLTAICGYLALIKKKSVTEFSEFEATGQELSYLTEDVKQYLDIIENRALYMKSLTEELFEFSGIMGNEENKPLELENIFLNQVLEDCIMDYYGALSEAGIEPEVEITEEKIVRSLNRQAIDRVFSNLMSNSIKYSKGDLKIKLTDDGVITFSNYAPQISSVDAKRLFDRFYTVETGKASTGLGLSIAKALVNQMNGTIEAEYENDYLIFRIRF